GKQKSVKISAQVMELNCAKCRELGIDITDNASLLLSRLETLKQNGALDVVTSPTLLTNSGHEAYIRLDECKSTASEANDRCPPKFELTVRPTVQSDNTVRMQVHFSANTCNLTNAAPANAFSSLAIEGSDIQTTVQLQSGQSALLTGLTK